jgi:superfamily II DNA or RNA helicase
MTPKDKLVQDSIQASKNTKNIMLEYATGCGKTLCSLRICEYKQYKKVLILVDETLNINTWTDEIKKWNIKIDYDIMCYASLHKIENIYDCVILDECDVITEKRFTYLINLDTSFIFLSAKVPLIKMNMLKQLCQFKRLKVTLTQAISLGVLPTPKIKIIRLNFDNTKTYIYIKGNKNKKTISCSFNDRFKYYGQYRVEIHCNEAQYYQLLSDDINYLKEQIRYNPSLKLPLQMKGLERKKFISAIKLRWLKEAINKFENKRMICFLSSIEDCNNFSKTESLHYESNKDIIEKFNKGEINRIFAINKLDRGKNLINIDLGIIAILNKNTTVKFIQELGRVLRSENPFVYLIIVNNTYEDSILKLIYEDINQKYFI